MPHLLENIIAGLLTTDIRPAAERDTFQVGAGRKRTTLRHVRVHKVGEPATKVVYQGPVANMGSTTWGTLKQGPMLRNAIYQGRNSGDLMDASCWWLAAMSGRTILDPYWCDDITIPCILPDLTPGVMVQLYYSSLIVQVYATLEVSTSYNNPNDDDIRPEVLQKAVGVVRKGISDMKGKDYGGGAEGLRLLGLNTGNLAATVAAIAAARAQGRAVTIITPASAKILFGAHCYCLEAADVGNALAIAWNPHDASLDTPIAASTLANTAEVAAVYFGELPSPKRLQCPAVINTNPPPEVLMPTAPVITIDSDHNAGAHAWDRVKFTWAATSTSGPITITVDGTPAPNIGGREFDMPEADRTITIIATGADGKAFSPVVRTIPLITTTTPTTPPVTPTTVVTDPITSITITRKSGKQETVKAL